MMRLNRKQKILRNLLVCLLLILAAYAALGFPPCTVKEMCERQRRNFLMPEMEPVYVLKEKHEFSGEWLSRRYTFIIARCEDTYLCFQYDWHGLQNTADSIRKPVIGGEVLCMARAGTMYVAGDFSDAASATAVVRASNGTEYRDYELSGEKLSEEVFGFEYGYTRGFVEDIPFEELRLGEIAEYWYRTPIGESSYSLNHAELPVTVTLYDEGGKTVDTLSLTVSTYDLHSWY